MQLQEGEEAEEKLGLAVLDVYSESFFYEIYIIVYNVI